MNRISKGTLLLLGPLILAGCASSDVDAGSVDRSVPVFGASAGEHPPTQAAAAEQDGVLTVDEAVRWVLATSPRAEAARQRVAAERARGEAAGTLPEPMLSVGVEALPFDSPREEEEWLIGLSLGLPTPGERGAERDVARARSTVAEAALRSTLLEVDAVARAAFAEAFLAERAGELAEAVAGLADERSVLFEMEVDAGVAAPLDLLDLREQQLRAGIALDAARREASAARARLELLLPEAAHGRALGGDPDAALALPELDALLERIDVLPRVAEAAAEARLAALRAELAEARRIPRVELAVAWRERADGRASLDAGLGVALPFGGRRSAEAGASAREAFAAGAHARARWQEVRGELLAAHAEARSAHEELRALEESLLPLADQRLARAQALVEAGAEPRTVVLEERARVLALQAEALAARARYHAAWARLYPLLLADD